MEIYFYFYQNLLIISIIFGKIRIIFPMNNDKVGEIIQKRRVYLKLTQKDVAEMAGITFKSISEIELGIRNPTLSMLNKILEVLGLTLSIHLRTVN
jgi:predicted transcriptional regulator